MMNETSTTRRATTTTMGLVIVASASLACASASATHRSAIVPTPIGVENVIVASARARAHAPKLGFSLKDVLPETVSSIVPHGAKGWEWKWGGIEGKTYTCKYDATLGAVDLDNPPKILTRFGTYGGAADTLTTKFNAAWFEDPEHYGDIQWTYRYCEQGEIIKCGSDAFAQVDPFPSIAPGEPGKRCQFIDTRVIPADDKNVSLIGPEGYRVDEDSLNVKVSMSTISSDGSRKQEELYVLSPEFVLAAVNRRYPDIKPQNLQWKWCANEGLGDDNRCECNTIMRYGWTGNTTMRAPLEKDDPAFVKFLYSDLRGEVRRVECHHEILGEIKPWPMRGEGNRICQCLSAEQMDEFDNVLSENIGGPVDYLTVSTESDTPSLGKSSIAVPDSKTGFSSASMSALAVCAAVVAFVAAKKVKKMPSDYEPLLDRVM